MKTTLFLSYLALASPLMANDTSLHPGRFGPEPLDGNGKESPVRMVAEHLQVAFGYRHTEVHCTFTFRNLQESGAVEQLVGFPDIGAALAEAKRRHGDDNALGETVNTAPMKSLQTRVDGQVMKTALQYGPIRKREGTAGYSVWSRHDAVGLAAWHTVRVNFPPGKDVKIERIYQIQNAASAAGVAFFDYTTATGAPWKGTIGRLQADVTLKDGLTAEKLVWPGTKRNGEPLSAELSMAPALSGWTVLKPTHLRLVWENFEPRTQAHRRGFTLSREFSGW
jgi:hypothetical protein